MLCALTVCRPRVRVEGADLPADHAATSCVRKVEIVELAQEGRRVLLGQLLQQPA